MCCAASPRAVWPFPASTGWSLPARTLWLLTFLDALKIVKPDTVLRWHRAGFRAYWRWKSRPRGGRPSTPAEIRDLIREMSIANPLWGAPRIHGELLKLGIDVGQTTVAKYMAKTTRHSPSAVSAQGVSRPMLKTGVISMPQPLYPQPPDGTFSYRPRALFSQRAAGIGAVSAEWAALEERLTLALARSLLVFSEDAVCWPSSRMMRCAGA